ncbi:MAG: hypothetical protein ACYDBB_15310 [Armatimonadota bacterium]
MLTAYVDSTDGYVARVLIGDESVAVAIPLHELPPGTRDGMVLCLRFSIDSGATAARANREKVKAYDAE